MALSDGVQMQGAFEPRHRAILQVLRDRVGDLDEVAVDQLLQALTTLNPRDDRWLRLEHFLVGARDLNDDVEDVYHPRKRRLT